MSALPNSVFPYQVGGSLDFNHSSYVVRQADSDLYQGLKAGEFCYVLNSRQMGKSSLRVQTMYKLQAEGIACTEIELNGIGSQAITAQQWYGGIIQELISGFQLKVNRRNWLTEHNDLSPVQCLSEFIDKILLREINQKIVIFVDEIDSVLSLSFLTDEFFALIRTCYNKRVDQPAYKRLTFVLLGVATPMELVQDKSFTPFNIGRAIELNGFQCHEAHLLAEGLVGKVSNPQTVLKQVLGWTGGQPFLTQKICQMIVDSSTFIPVGREAQLVKLLVQNQLIQAWESQDEPPHLRTIRDRIVSRPERKFTLLSLYKKILSWGKIKADNSNEQLELRLSGLVIKQRGYLKVSNRIYQFVFNRKWVSKELQVRNFIFNRKWVSKGRQVRRSKISTLTLFQMSLIISIVVMAVRWCGIFQPMELSALDHLMRLRPNESQDSRMLIITIDDQDIKFQEQLGIKLQNSLSDQALVQLLKKLEPHQPKVIGLDIYREHLSTEPEYSTSAIHLRNENFIDVCQIGEKENNSPEFSPPPGVPIERVGFSDLPRDPDNVIRRQIFGMSPGSVCTTDKSFSYQVALRYLSYINISEHEVGPEKLTQIGTVVFKKLELHTGGYHNLKLGGYEILLNYRAVEPIAEQVALREILSQSRDSQLPNLVKDRIVLIGVISTIMYNDYYHITPYSQDFQTLKEKPGVMVQAHMISHILGAVLDKRPVLWWWPQWGDGLWVWSWSFMAGMGSIRFWRLRLLHQRLLLGVAFGAFYIICSISLYLSCFIILWKLGGWMPLWPSAFSLLLTYILTIVYTYYKVQQHS